MSKSTIRTVAYDCKYLHPDRPCTWHKKEGVVCVCGNYAPQRDNILIIKLDAMGDVLRTTCLLPLIDRKWPHARISWITRSESVPLLENNPYIAEVLSYGMDAAMHLGATNYDRVINLDAGKLSTCMATMARTNERIGYFLNEAGHIQGNNAAADEWLQMGIFDDLKRQNRRTYQEIMCSILEVPVQGMRYVLNLTEAELLSGRKALETLGMDLGKKIIGVHTGGGGRWSLKQWNEDKFSSLIRELVSEQDTQNQVLLFGGPLERDMNRRIANNVDAPIFDSGCDNTLRQFASLASCCSVMLSGDSLAMHVALATGCRVVVLFGPTSNTEIELFGQGEKVIPEIDCLCCYKRACDKKPNCMDAISVDMVKKAVVRQLAATEQRCYE